MAFFITCGIPLCIIFPILLLLLILLVLLNLFLPLSPPLLILFFYVRIGTIYYQTFLHTPFLACLATLLDHFSGFWCVSHFRANWWCRLWRVFWQTHRISQLTLVLLHALVALPQRPCGIACCRCLHGL